MMTETEIIPMPQDMAKEFGIAFYAAPLYDLVRVTSSDYDEGGKNKVVMCFPCPVGTPLWNKEVMAAIEVCKKNSMESLSAQVERQRKKEKFFPMLERLARREWRYFLSITKMGKQIPENRG